MKLHAYLLFNGQCEDAFRFYAESLGGEISMISRFKDAPPEAKSDPKMSEPKYENYVMHVSMTAGETLIMGSDCPPSNAADFGDNVNLSLSFNDEATQKKHFELIARGGEVIMPLADAFWGSRFGMVKDKFGICWMFNCEKGAKH